MTTGKSNHPYKVLLHKLRKDRNKSKIIIGGKRWKTPKKGRLTTDGPMIQSGKLESLVKDTKALASDNKLRVTQNLNTMKIEKDIKSGIVDESALQSTVSSIENTSATFSVLEGVVPIAAPILAGSGVGIPLAAILVLANQFAKYAKSNIILTNMLNYVINIISNCYFLERLIGKTMKVFKDTASNNEKLPNRTIRDAIMGMNIKTNVTVQLKIKLERLNKLIADIAPDDLLGKNTGSLSRTSKRIQRFFFSEKNITEIIRELTIVNSLFIVYNSQFDWIVRFFERKLQHEKTGSSGGVVLLDAIWEEIEKSAEYKEYLNPPRIEDMEKVIEDDVEELKIAEQVDDHNKQLIESKKLNLNETENVTQVPGPAAGQTPTPDATGVENETKGGTSIKRKTPRRNNTYKIRNAFVRI